VVGRPITAATAGRELQADIQNNAGLRWFRRSSSTSLACARLIADAVRLSPRDVTPLPATVKLNVRTSGRVCSKTHTSAVVEKCAFRFGGMSSRGRTAPNFRARQVTDSTTRKQSNTYRRRSEHPLSGVLAHLRHNMVSFGVA